jgi:hypothetical protein
MRKKNQKRINPRYFLHETVLREQEQSDRLIFALAQMISGDICRDWKNVYDGALALMSMSDHPQASGYLRKIKEITNDMKRKELGQRSQRGSLSGGDTPDMGLELAWSRINELIRHIERLHNHPEHYIARGVDADKERLSQKVKDLAQCPEGDERYGR